MKYLFPILLAFFLQGCTDEPTPRTEKDIQAKSVIEANIGDAQQAREEYLALQAKRQKETAL